ncbi:hypothetical protein CRG98_010740 [Punica granatum]|uniref:Uncharacterized protein n=1 Tax=Punica granatum TaxID=22663 RepID=A0A2I0KK35_PUNGR|nr:hypothetical protein CRG98_010740 [Punica granatum]
MVIPSSGMRDGTVKSRAGPLLDRVWAVLACTDPNGNNRPDWRFLDLTGTPEKIRRVQAFPAERLDWASLGSNIAMVASDGFWPQDRWPTVAKGPLEVTVVVTWRKRYFEEEEKCKLPYLLENSAMMGKEKTMVDLWVPHGLEVGLFYHSGVIQGVCMTFEKQSEAMLMICRIAGYDCV